MLTHNLISLETHILNVANIAMMYARLKGKSNDIQKKTWEYGFSHDAGKLNLGPMFKHDNATPKTLNALKSSTNTKTNFSIDDKLLVEFARLHARYHISKNKQPLYDFLKAHNHPTTILDFIIYGDRLATAAEKPGTFYSHQPNIIQKFTTLLTQSIPHNFVNTTRAFAHSEIMRDFLTILDEITYEISHEIGVDFAPIITQNFDHVQYVLDTSSELLLQQKLENKLSSYILENIAYLVKKRKSVDVYSIDDYKQGIFPEKTSESPGNHACVFCNSPSKYVKTTYLLPVFSGRNKKVTAEFWWKQARDKFGVCPGCLYAITRYELHMRKRDEDENTKKRKSKYERPVMLILSQEDFSKIRFKNAKEQLRKWQKLVNNGVCLPDRKYLNLNTWLHSPYVTEYDDIDSRKETYLYTKRMYENVITLLKNNDEIEVDDHSVIAYLYADLDIIVDALESIDDFTALYIDNLKPMRGTNFVNLCGFYFEKEIGLPILRLYGILVKNRYVREVFLESNSFAGFLAQLTTVDKVKKTDRENLITSYLEIENEFDTRYSPAKKDLKIEEVFDKLKEICYHL